MVEAESSRVRLGDGGWTGGGGRELGGWNPGADELEVGESVMQRQPLSSQRECEAAERRENGWPQGDGSWNNAAGRWVKTQG